MASEDSGLDLARLAKLQAKTKVGAKGAPRKKIVSKPKNSGQVDQKVQVRLNSLALTRKREHLCFGVL